MFESIAVHMTELHAYVLAAAIIIATPKVCIWLFTRPLP
jgi:hypothetical protein